MISNPTGREVLGLSDLPPERAVADARVPKPVNDIITGRCSMCHTQQPVWSGLASPPKGVRLDSGREIARHAEAIRMQAVLTNAMPPNNITGMTIDERRALARWLAQL
jgi:uncharacterized membrane protein